MADKNKTQGPPPIDPETIRRTLLLHIEATLHRELLEEAMALQVAGKLRQSRRLLKRAEELHARLTALEVGVRLPSRVPGQKGSDE